MPSLNYQSLGKGRDLIFLHGFAMDSYILMTYAQWLSQFYRVHLFDLPGFGENATDVLKSNMAQVSEQLLYNLPSTKAIWMGWSLGGLIATWIGIHHPERVSSLINIASSPYFMATSNWPGIAEIELLKFAKDLKKNYLKTLYKFLTLQCHEGSMSEITIKSLRKHLKFKPPPSIDTLEAGLHLLVSNDLRNHLSSLQVPCLYLLGGKDKLVPAQIAGRMSSPQIHTHIIGEAAHLPFLSHPQACFSTLQHFLNHTCI